MSADNSLVVLSTTALKTTFDEIGAEFCQLTGKKLSVEFGPSVRTSRRIRDGEQIDLVIIASDAVDELIEQGFVVRGSRIDVATSELAVAVAAGAAMPDVSSVEALKRTLLDARTVGLSNPAGGGRSGIHMQSVLERLGIKDALEPKIVYGGGGPKGLISLLVVEGKAQIGIQQKAELLAVPGIAIAGALPESLQGKTVFSVATPAQSRDRQAGLHLVGLLRTPAVERRLRENGLDPIA